MSPEQAKALVMLCYGLKDLALTLMVYPWPRCVQPCRGIASLALTPSVFIKLLSLYLTVSLTIPLTSSLASTGESSTPAAEPGVSRNVTGWMVTHEQSYMCDTMVHSLTHGSTESVGFP